MNLKEFKSWLDGFCEGLGRAPNEDEWKRIKEKIDNITVSPDVVLTREIREVPVIIREKYQPFIPMIHPNPSPWNPPFPQIWCESTNTLTNHANHSIPVSGAIANGIN